MKLPRRSIVLLVVDVCYILLCLAACLSGIQLEVTMQSLRSVKQDAFEAFDPSFSETEQWVRITLEMACILMLLMLMLVIAIPCVIVIGFLLASRTFKGKTKKKAST